MIVPFIHFLFQQDAEPQVRKRGSLKGGRPLHAPIEQKKPPDELRADLKEGAHGKKPRCHTGCLEKRGNQDTKARTLRFFTEKA